MGKEKEKSRIYPRHKIFSDITIKTKKKEIIGVVYNISRGGLSIVTESALRAGDKCTIKLLTAHSDDYIFQGTIVQSNFIERNIWKYGVEFIEPVSKVEFGIIIEQFKIL